MARLFMSLYLSIAVFTIIFAMASSRFIFMASDDMVLRERTEDIQGWLFTIDELAKHYSGEQWHNLSERISAHSSLPTKFLRMNDVRAVYPLAYKSMEEHALYFNDLEGYEFFYRLDDDAGVLHVGPFASPDNGINDWELYLDYVFLILLALVVLCWNLRLGYKLRQLESAAVAFGNGDLNVRASEKAHHRIGQLNAQFNLMAEKIATLITKNRDLVNAVSHELRSPISRLKCELELATSASDYESQNRYIGTMTDDLVELELLVEDILMFSRQERSDPPDLIEGRLILPLQKLLSTWQREFSVKISLKCQTDLCAVYNARKLVTVLNNLVRNSASYGASEIKISTQELPDIQRVAIHVDDDGPGIPVESREKIFNPFHRLDQSRADSGGYGLGLTIAHTAARLQRGSITVADSPIGGARFSLMLPMSDE